MKLSVVEQEHILSVLRSHGGNRTRTAKALGIALSTLHRRLRMWGMNQPHPSALYAAVSPGTLNLNPEGEAK